MEQRNDQRWAAKSAQLLWRTWDDAEFVVYHIPSGDTHLLNLVAAEALRALEHNPLDSRELVDHVARSLDFLPDDAFPLHIETLVAKLSELGLITPVQ